MPALIKDAAQEAIIPRTYVMSPPNYSCLASSELSRSATPLMDRTMGKFLYPPNV
jgi:hypothetical protein